MNYKKNHKMIRMRSVNKWYGKIQVLNECSLDVSKGEVIVVCGPSGSGKSTLIKTINGLVPVNSGEIIVSGINVTDKSTDLDQMRSKIGMVFQNFELFPHMNVTENIKLGQTKVLGRTSEEAEQKTKTLLERRALATRGTTRDGRGTFLHA